jgi:DNA modification methylase
MCGHYWLGKVMDSLSLSLRYRWVNASVWDRQGNTIHLGRSNGTHGRIVSKWKPILVYSKGDLTRRNQWCDVYRDNCKEKEWHPWQQPLDLFESLVRDFSDPGNLIVDPCGGGFTTAEACLRLGRRCISCDVEAGCVSKGLERLERAKLA